MDNGYNKYMMLKIRSVSASDFGSYRCVAKNSLGETDGVIKLEGKSFSSILHIYIYFFNSKTLEYYLILNALL